MNINNDDNLEIKIATPIKSIRKKCLDCTCGQSKEVKLCTAYGCSIWPYRMGRRPTPVDLYVRGERQ